MPSPPPVQRCILCRTATVDKYAACRPCLKRAARRAARATLRQEMRRDARLYDEIFQMARLKTLTNRYERIMKRRLKGRFRRGDADV